jgi:exopolysaccharide biosynthesis polyprenyl glycosylphosphotransferase
LYEPASLLNVRLYLPRALVATVLVGIGAFALAIFDRQSAWLASLMLASIAGFAAVMALRTLIVRLASPDTFRTRTVIVGTDREVDALLYWIRVRPEQRITVIACKRVAGGAAETWAAAQRWIDDIVRGCAGAQAVHSVVVACPGASSVAPAGAGRTASLVPLVSSAEFREQGSGQVALDEGDTGWLERVRRQGTVAATSRSKRTMDIAVSLLSLIFFAPLMGFIALAIKFDSPGPVFYRQVRVGLGGRPFEILKFRSMRVDAESASGPQWAARNDSRVSNVGRFLRMTRMDEIPQLVNVLRGEMSLVGPRPERPMFVDQMSEIFDAYSDRHCTKPGITGWAQINYQYGASYEDAREKLKYDLYYRKNFTIWLDLRIILKTFRVIFLAEGAR